MPLRNYWGGQRKWQNQGHDTLKGLGMVWGLVGLVGSICGYKAC